LGYNKKQDLARLLQKNTKNHCFHTSNLTHMKRSYTLLLALFLVFGAVLSASAQKTDELKKQDKEILKDLKDKAIKEAKKEAKKYKKAGYLVAPGSIPMEKMLEEAWIRQLERDEKGNLKYLQADGNGVANSRSAAEVQAIEFAKLNLAGQLESDIRAIIQSNIANEQLSNVDATSITKILATAKNFIAVKLGKIDPIFKIYKNLDNNNVEVNVKLIYNKAMAMDIAKQAVKEEMQKELKDLTLQLDQIIGIDPPASQDPKN